MTTLPASLIFDACDMIWERHENKVKVMQNKVCHTHAASYTGRWVGVRMGRVGKRASRLRLALLKWYRLASLVSLTL